jgi:hypothetical protein
MSANGVIPASTSQPAKPGQNTALTGLTSGEAQTRLEKDGPNAMPDTSAHPLRNAVAKFVKGGAKVDHFGGAKGYQQRER